MVTKQFFESGFKRIIDVYTDMLSYKDLKIWAYDFRFNLSNFREVRNSFEKSKITAYLKSVYENKCSSSLEPMYDAFRCVNLYTYFCVIFLSTPCGHNHTDSMNIYLPQE